VLASESAAGTNRARRRTGWRSQDRYGEDPAEVFVADTQFGSATSLSAFATRWAADRQPLLWVLEDLHDADL